LRANAHPEDTAACPGVDWRATVDEDGHYSFAVPLWCRGALHAAKTAGRHRVMPPSLPAVATADPGCRPQQPSTV